MSDRLFADCCFGSEHQHMASQPCPQDTIKVLSQALQDVCDPIGKMQRDCPPGHELNHQAVTIGGTLQFVQAIARKALQQAHVETGSPLPHNNGSIG